MPDPARIMLFSSEFPPGPGGIGAHAYQLAMHLTQLNWKLEVATPQAYVSPEQVIAFNDQLPFSVTDLTSLSTFQRIRLLQWKIRQFKPDILIASGERPFWITALFSRLFNLPWLAIGHGTEFHDPSRLNQLFTYLSIRRADRIVAVSQYTANLMAELGCTHITVVPNGADNELYEPNLDAETLRGDLGLANKRILLTVGNVSERKAQDIVIRALPEILESHPDIIYLIVGLPTRQPQLEQLAAELGVADHVCFTGIVSKEDLPLYYNLCDLFVLVSRKAQSGDVEGYGIVVIEAALCGRTAVVSNHGGLPEAVHDGTTGIVVPIESPNETAKAVIRLLDDDIFRQKLESEALRQAAKATWSHRIKAYDNVLRGILH